MVETDLTNTDNNALLWLTHMDQEEQQNAFEDALCAVIDRFVAEFNLSLSSALGVLEKVKLDTYFREAMEPVDK